MGFSFCCSSVAATASAPLDLLLSPDVPAALRPDAAPPTVGSPTVPASLASRCADRASRVRLFRACFACPTPCLGLQPSAYGSGPIQACVGGSAFAQA